MTYLKSLASHNDNSNIIVSKNIYIENTCPENLLSIVSL